MDKTIPTETDNPKIIFKKSLPIKFQKSIRLEQILLLLLFIIFLSI